ncbi:MAG: hypothetical protein HQL16_01330 [Candidatus Omnitrophica bacterium]|nr:hypothetical protein [Candidatus Omnitrophota bacterium]
MRKVADKRKFQSKQKKNNLKSIQETSYLLSISGMKDSILADGKTSIKSCATSLKW